MAEWFALRTFSPRQRGVSGRKVGYVSVGNAKSVVVGLKLETPQINGMDESRRVYLVRESLVFANVMIAVPGLMCNIIGDGVVG